MENYAQLWSQRGPKWSQMVEYSQYLIINLIQEKNVSVTHGKKGIRPQKDGPGPVMVSDTLFPAVQILGT